MIRAELTKLATLRSTPLTLVLAVMAGAGLSALVGSAMRSVDDERFDPVFASFYGLTVAQIGLVVFAVLAIGGEYRSGTIRVSLAAMPRRGAFYAAKVVAVTLPLAVAALLLVLASFFPAQAVLGERGVGAGEVPSALVGGWVSLVLLGLFALGVTTALRSSALALGILLPLLLLGSQGLGNVPGLRVVTQFFPDQLAGVILHLAGPQDEARWARAYGPWTGVGLLALETALALLAGYLVLRRRDA